MLYKYMFLEQDSRFVIASGRSPAPRGRGTDSVRTDLALTRHLDLQHLITSLDGQRPNALALAHCIF